jgi:hypothetical protein
MAAATDGEQHAVIAREVDRRDDVGDVDMKAGILAQLAGRIPLSGTFLEKATRIETFRRAR